MTLQHRFPIKSERQTAIQHAHDFAEQIHTLCRINKWLLPAALILMAGSVYDFGATLSVAGIIPLPCAILDHCFALKYLTWRECLEIVRCRF